MPQTHRFPSRIVGALDKGKTLRIRAGAGTHRFIGIWVVVVEDRVFVRSWERGPDGWLATLRQHSVGAIQLANRTVAVRARSVRSERMLRAVDEAYFAKYTTPGARKYVSGFREGQRRATTTELLPARCG